MKIPELEPIIVDDDEAARNEISAFLRDKCNMKPIPLGSGKEAIEFLKNSKNGHHVVLSDVLMPKMGGDELLHYIRKNYPDVEVVLMSAYKDHKAAMTGVNEHAYYYYQKPLDNLRNVALTLREAAKHAQARKERRLLIEAFKEWVDNLENPESFQLMIGNQMYSPTQLLEEVQNGSEVGEDYLKTLLYTAVEIVSGRFSITEN